MVDYFDCKESLVPLKKSWSVPDYSERADAIPNPVLIPRLIRSHRHRDDHRDLLLAVFDLRHQERVQLIIGKKGYIVHRSLAQGEKRQ